MAICCLLIHYQTLCFFGSIVTRTETGERERLMFTLQDVLTRNQETLTIHSTAPMNPQLLFQSAQHDSRQCGPGDLFVAIKGTRVDGYSFIPDMVKVGALA